MIGITLRDQGNLGSVGQLKLELDRGGARVGVVSPRRPGLGARCGQATGGMRSVVGGYPIYIGFGLSLAGGAVRRSPASETVDVVVIGMGPGGEEVAGSLTEAGLKVVGVESQLVGGECPYRGCVP